MSIIFLLKKRKITFLLKINIVKKRKIVIRPKRIIKLRFKIMNLFANSLLKNK